MTEKNYHGHCPYCKKEVPLNMKQVNIESIMSTPGPVRFLIYHPTSDKAVKLMSKKVGHLIIFYY